MKKEEYLIKGKPLIVLATLLLCDCTSYAIVEFKDGLIHDIDYVIDDQVYVDYQTPMMYTTVNMLDGARMGYNYPLSGYENSRINIYGGIVTNIHIYNSSNADISGGTIHSFESHDFSHVDIFWGEIGSHIYSNNYSQVNISGGWIGGEIYSHDYSRVNISGGLINGGLISYDSSQVIMSGGSIFGIYTRYSSQLNISGDSIVEYGIQTGESSIVDISGGTIGALRSGKFSQINISGGSIGSDLTLHDQSVIQIFGYDFAVDSQAVNYGELTSILGGSALDEPLRHLTGTLLSGEMIDNDFRIGYDAKIILIPEPGTVLLLSLGALFIRSKRRRGF